MAKKKSNVKNKKDKKEDNHIEEISEKKIPSSFLFVLSVMSVLGFFGTAMRTLFNVHLETYIEATWLIVLGFGMIKESDLMGLILIKETGVTPEKFKNIVVCTIGVLAVITGILILPQINIATPALLAIQGILSIIAMVLVIVRSFVLKNAE